MTITLLPFRAGAALMAAASLHATTAAAQTAARSATIDNVHYELTFDAATAASRQLGVAMTFRAGDAEPVLLSFPTWTPGAYDVSNFARKVLNFTATAADRPLVWDKLDYDTWRIRPTGPGDVTIRFEYRADSLDNAMAWSTSDFLLVNGTNVLPYPEGRPFDFPARVTVRTEAAWHVATGMSGSGAARQYTAANYHELVDMPIFIGALDLDSNRVDGKWYRLASYPRGVLAGAQRETFWQWTRDMMPPMHAVFGEMPWDTYTILLIFDQDFPGGSALEHENSHVGIYNPRFIGNPLLASITAHEIFHAWNVKRLRPAEMVPYDYSRPQPTTLLWVSEGITDYYADLALVRGGIVPAQLFYEITQGKIRNVAASPAAALEDASLSTWISPIDGSGFVYYPKGSLAGFLIDVLVRDATDNRRSLDDVLRRLYESTHKAGNGFTVDDWWRAVRETAGGKAFDEFSRRYIDGREPFPYREVLPLAGWSLAVDTVHVPFIGISTGSDDEGVRVTDVVPNSSAAAAGVRIGDYLVRIGDVEVTDDTFGARFRQRYGSASAGTPLPMVVRRGGESVTLDGRLRLDARENFRVVEDPNASPKARRIREGILTGKTQR